MRCRKAYFMYVKKIRFYALRKLEYVFINILLFLTHKIGMDQS